MQILFAYFTRLCLNLVWLYGDDVADRLNSKNRLQRGWQRGLENLVFFREKKSLESESINHDVSENSSVSKCMGLCGNLMRRFIDLFWLIHLEKKRSKISAIPN